MHFEFCPVSSGLIRTTFYTALVEMLMNSRSLGLHGAGLDDSHGKTSWFLSFNCPMKAQKTCRKQ